MTLRDARLSSLPAVAADALAGRVFLVTGAGDGIGATAARALAAAGATVVLLGRTVRRLEAVYDQIVAGGAPRPAIYPMNLEGAVVDDYQRLADTLARELGRLDGLVSAAGELGTLTPLAHYDPLTWARVVQVNLHAPFLLARVCLPLLLEREDASLTFLTDAVGRSPRAYWGAYAVAHAGLDAAAGLLAIELEGWPQVRVNLLDPGPRRTRLRARAYPAEDPRRIPDAEALAPLFVQVAMAGPEAPRGVRILADAEGIGDGTAGGNELPVGC